MQRLVGTRFHKKSGKVSLYSCDIADRCCFMGVWFATRCTHSRPRSFFTQLHFYPFEHLSNCCSCKPPKNWIRHSLRLNLCLDKNSGSCSRLWTARSQPPTLRSARKPSIHRSPAVMARCRRVAPTAPSASSMAADRNRNRSENKYKYNCISRYSFINL